jgi:hypothetical protein
MLAMTMTRLLAILALAFSACSGPVDDTATDSSNMLYDLRMPFDAGPDFSAPSIASGKMIAAGKEFVLVGVTSDDYAVVFANAATGVLSLDGGPTTSIGDNAVVVVAGKLVLSWTNVDKNGIGDLHVWSAAGGLSSAKVSGSIIADYGALDDGSTVLYAVATDAGGTTADAYVAKADLTGAVKIASGIQVSTSVANPNPCSGFAIPTGSSFVHVSCLADAPDGGAKVFTGSVDAVAANGMVTNLATNVKPFAAVDKDGKQVFVIDAADQGSVVPIGGGQATPVDKTIHTGFFLSDGRVAYDTTGNHFLTAVPGMAPVDVGPTNFTNFLFAATHPASSDGKYVVYYAKQNQMTGFTDIYLQSTAPGAAVSLTDKQTGAIFGDAFTADDSHALYYTDCQIVGSGVFGTLTSLPVAGGTPSVVGMRVYSDFATTGTGLVFNDNWKAGSVYGTADIEYLADSTKTAPPTLIATRAESTIFLNHDRTKVVYNSITVVGNEGIYVAPLQ